MNRSRMHFNEIELDYDPRRQIMPQLPRYDGEPEMSDFDSAFLCGLIKKVRPKKLIEVGIAAGATSSIIMQAVKDLGLDTQLYFVDKFEDCYRVKDQKSGFLGRQTAELLDMTENVNFMLGKVLPQRLDEIGKDIDLVLLDTVHYLPGEMLDFLAVIPYLSPKAFVCLHDVWFNQGEYRNKDGISCPAVFGGAVGEKYLNWLPEKNHHGGIYPNIGAIEVGEETVAYIDNLFCLTMLSWAYMPSDQDLNAYSDLYARHYSKENLAVFRSAIEENRYNLSHAPLEDKKWLSDNLFSNTATEQYSFNNNI